MVAIDTNLLIAAFRKSDPQHQAAQIAISHANRRTEGWGIPLQCLAEFWTVATHPNIPGGPPPPQGARDFILGLITAGAAIWLPHDGFPIRLMQLAVSLKINGPRIFDLQIALTALDNGATELWTQDTRFIGIAGIKIVQPF